MITFDTLKAMAPQTLMRDGYHAPMVFVLGKPNLIILMSYNNDNEKNFQFLEISEVLKQYEATDYIHVHEAYVRNVSSKEHAEFIESNYDSQRPSVYKERREALMVSAVNITGKSKQWGIYFRKENDKIILEEEFPEVDETQVSGLAHNFFNFKPHELDLSHLDTMPHIHIVGQ